MRKSVRNHVVSSRKIGLNKYIPSEGTQHRCPVRINSEQRKFQLKLTIERMFCAGQHLEIFSSDCHDISPTSQPVTVSQSQRAQFL